MAVQTLEPATRKNGAAPTEDDPGTQIVPAAPKTHAPLVHRLLPQSVEQAIVLADQFGQSGMFAVKNKAQALTILLTGLELGLGPAQSMRAFHVIEGKPSPSADTMMALCLSRPDVCKYFTVIESSRERAVFETWRVGAPGPVRISYTIEDARDANLLGKKVWKENMPQMLLARGKSKTARVIYPDLTLGLYTPEELGDSSVIEAEYGAASQGAVWEDDRGNEQSVSALTEAEWAGMCKAITALFMSAQETDAALYQRLKETRARLYGSRKFGKYASRTADDLSDAELTRLHAELCHTAKTPVEADSDVIEADVKDAAPPASPACNRCSKAITEAQKQLSIRNYGEVLCPACQKLSKRAPNTPSAPAQSEDDAEFEALVGGGDEEDPFAGDSDAIAAESARTRPATAKGNSPANKKDQAKA